MPNFFITIYKKIDSSNNLYYIQSDPTLEMEIAMTMKNNSKGPLEQAEDLIKESGIWSRCHAMGGIGRTYGTHAKGHNCAMPGSHISLMDGHVIIIIHSVEGKRYNPITVRKFGESDLSTLERDVIELLRKAELLLTPIP